MNGIDPDSKEFCEMAWEEAQNMCATPEQVFAQAARFMGFTPEEIDELTPFDETCGSILDEGLTTEVCVDLLAVRKWILARAWDAHTESGYPVTEAFQLAWSEATTGCFS